MRDISEISGDTEQAKSTTPHTRTGARSRTDNQPAQALTSSQEQETKSATPRRRPTSSPATNTTGQTAQGASAERPTQNTGTSTTTNQTRPSSAPRRANTAPTNRTSAPATDAPSQRANGNNRSYGSSSSIGNGGSRNNNSANEQRYNNTEGGSNNGAARPINRNNGTAPQQRSGNGSSSQPRQGNGQYPQRPAGQGNGQAPQQRSGNWQSSQQRSGNGQNSPQRTGNGQGNYSSQGQRSGNGRPGNAQGQRPGNGRPGTRPGGASARTQERRAPAVKEKPTGPISLPPQIVVKDLADLLSISPIEVIRELINKHAIFASINQVVDYEKAAMVAKDLGFEPSQSEVSDTTAPQGERQLSASEAMVASRDEDNMVTIPPVVTIMGHVDHGKTSLLDTIRKTKVAAGEAGGITQHIGAYQVEINGKKITFLDTPGHEAFTAMRARGAQVTHIVIIVVAADDGVMPQTREAIDHARAAKVPIIIAINKIDKANANPDRVKQQLAEMGVVIEEYGGDVISVPVSARQGLGIDELLEYILLVAEVQDIRANPNRAATGVIIEAKLEKNSGATATVLVQQGTLKMGDNIVVGAIAGKVRAMFNDRGKRIQKAPPSTPVSILGLAEVPQAGDRLEVVPDERTAKQKAQQEAERRKSEAAPLGQVSLDTLYMQMQEGTVKELNVVIKSDVQGSLEAIKGSLSKLGEENMKVRLIHEGIGNISETDVHLAGASGAVIIGFNVKADGAAQRTAQREHVDIRYYEVIYKLIEDIQAALVGMLEPTYREVIDGHAEVVQTFKAGKNTVIAGCRITDGRIARSSQARIVRKDEKVFDGKVASLRRGKDDVREVLTGYECGIVLEDFNDFEVGDVIEAYSQERVAPGA
jgi:translation initiation factor IF-2